MATVNENINRLVNYAIRKELIEENDRAYTVNALMYALGVTEYEDSTVDDSDDLENILSMICDYAFEKGLIESDSTSYRDLFDTYIMGLITPRPSLVISRFNSLYSTSPETATDYFYKLSKDCDYIRSYRIVKDLRWTVPSEYGDIDITVNLSKPEKDPKAIAAAKLLAQSGYPKCMLCHENEGFSGNISKSARQTLRQIPITLKGNQWYLQYSPYVYYNEHCIVLSAEHTPMKIDKNTFYNLLDFVELFPHYFLGSNADLPIVGGSILSHDHMQGGHYTFAMERAQIEQSISFNGFEDIEAGIVKWPMSVIRLRCASKERLADLSDKILGLWRSYTDEDAFIYACTDNEPHNTVTPIARMKDGKFEMNLVLRNNITTNEHPLGVFHPHSDLHNIKKENIGLIEVMGLAVLPSRLKDEMVLLKDAVLKGKDFKNDPIIGKHSSWFESFKDEYGFTKENIDKILRKRIGATFVKVLEDSGVYKRTPAGKAAFLRFIDYVNNK